MASSAREMSEPARGNVSHALADLFQDLFAVLPAQAPAPGSKLDALDALARNMSAAELPDFGTLVRVLAGVRSQLDLAAGAPERCRYCGGGLRDLVLSYNTVHGYISLLVCVFGSLANALNVAVLTRRDMATAPINRLLKWLAVADVFVMLEYVPFAAYKYLVLPGALDFPYSGAAYLLFHMYYTQILHTASICLTISLAVWRYLAIKYSDRSHILCTERRCSVAILSSFLLPPLLCIPTFMVFDIHTTVVYEHNTPTLLYHVDSDREGALYQLNFWVHAVLVKLLPCAVLTAISAWLVRALYSANSRQKTLRGESPRVKSEIAARRQRKADKRTDRTSRMLLAVLLLFLATELPQGVLGLLSGLLGRCFFKRCYDLFGELMDILALLNGAINFVLYCCMSRQFRLTFGAMVQPHKSRWRSALAPMQPMRSHSDFQNTARTSAP